MIRKYNPNDRVKVIRIVNICGRDGIWPDYKEKNLCKHGCVSTVKFTTSGAINITTARDPIYRNDTEEYKLNIYDYGNNFSYAQSDLTLAPPP